MTTIEIIQELKKNQSILLALIEKQSQLLNQLENSSEKPEDTAEYAYSGPPIFDYLVPDKIHDQPQNEEPAIPESPIIPESESIEPSQPAAANPATPIPSKANLNEKLASAKATTPVENFAGGKIEDLGKAFTLNQKLAFIKQLFGNDAELYNGTIQNINMAADYDEAERILLEKVNREESDILDELLSYIHRRFI
jgi:hypothetical protein